MRMIAIHVQTERKWLDRSVRCAEKRRRQASTLQIRGPIYPVPDVRATAQGVQGEKTIDQRATSGDLDVRRQATWGMSGFSICGKVKHHKYPHQPVS